MITDKDIEKIKTSLKNTFITKDEFQRMEDRTNEKFTDMKLSIIQCMNSNTQLILQELQSQRTDWKNHERRITRLEEKAGFIV